MYKIIVDYSPSEQDNTIVREGIVAFNERIVGERERPLSIFLKSTSGNIVGGIQAWFDLESVWIDVLWVTEDLRKKGYGKELLKTVEKEAIKQGCIFSRIDTWSFQAEEFYLKCGYQRVGEIKNHWLMHTKIFFRKNLTAENLPYPQKTYISELKEMFSEMVIKKNAALIPLYYHSDFLLYTNNQVIDYAGFIKSHQEYFATNIQYEVAYDEETFIEQEEKIAGRLWITICQPGELTKKIEVVLIVLFKENKIYRLWELTYPDWA